MLQSNRLVLLKKWRKSIETTFELLIREKIDINHIRGIITICGAEILYEVR